MTTYVKAFLLALQYLTGLPSPVAVPPNEPPDKRTARLSLALFPLAGWLIGGILYALCIFFMLPGRFSELTIAVFIVVSEALLSSVHLDGLADSCDAFFSTAQTPERKLEIMKDSRIGVMGGLALILSLLLKTVLISECIRFNLQAVIVIYPVMGKLAQVVLFKTSPFIRAGGIGEVFSKAATTWVFWGAVGLALPSLLLLSPHQFTAYALYAAFLYRYKHLSERHIGGITGDVLGSATVISEIVFLTAFPLSMIAESIFRRFL